MREISQKKSSSNWKAIIITFAVIGAILLGGGLIYFLQKNKYKSNQQVNLGEQQRQQVKEAVSQLAGSILDNQNNFNQLTTNPDGTRRNIDDIEEVFLSGNLNQQPHKRQGQCY